jgi:hypothetical protein
MKSSPEVETVTQESLFLVTRATVKKARVDGLVDY